MFKNRNYNNASQKRLAKFALIKYRINFRSYGINTAMFIISHFVDMRCLFEGGGYLRALFSGNTGLTLM